MVIYSKQFSRQMAKSLIPRGKMDAFMPTVNYPDTSGGVAPEPAVAPRLDLAPGRTGGNRARAQLAEGGQGGQMMDSLIALNALTQCEPAFALDGSLAV